MAINGQTEDFKSKMLGKNQHGLVRLHAQYFKMIMHGWLAKKIDVGLLLLVDTFVLKANSLGHN